MPGDPQGCRFHAARCLKRARRTKNSEAAKNLAAMAETWKMLAAQIESDQRLLHAIYEMKFPEPYETLPFLLNLRSGSH
jgi:hypothetical protein